MVWYLSNGIDKALFEKMLAAFAREVGAGTERIVILILDNAGWHGPENLEMPPGLRLVFLPPYSPELQPAECLWPLVDEAVANRHFKTLADLDAKIAERCLKLDADTVRKNTHFHWWPKSKTQN